MSRFTPFRWKSHVPGKALRWLTAAALLLSTGSLSAEIHLKPIGTYATGQFDESAAEIPAFDPLTDRLFVVNANKGEVDVIDISDPTLPALLFSIAAKDADAAEVNSVAVSNGLVALAVAHQDAGSTGWIEVYNTNLNAADAPLATYPAGVLPDMVTFSPDGTKILTANEGETDGEDNDPRDSEFTVNPPGSVTVVDISGGAAAGVVTQIGFDAFNGQETTLRNSGVLIWPGDEDSAPNSFSTDAEPEYVAVSPDGLTAFVTLQENNAVAKIDLTTNTVTAILPMGFKDHSLPGNELDPSDRDSGVNIQNWPVFGMYMPDAIATYEVGGTTYYVTANEGDARGDDGVELERLKNLEDVGLSLDETVFPNAADLLEDEELGRIEVRFVRGDIDGDDDLDQIYVYGGRSFSIYDENGNQVFDSGSQFEQITASLLPPETFNSTNDENDSFDSRSDAKGPEPEGVTIAEFGGRILAFILLERVGGVMVYDISDPIAPEFLTYVNNRNFDPDLDAETQLEQVGDLGPEGAVFVDAADSPNGKALLIVANEVSGTTTIYTVEDLFPLQILHASDLEGGVDALERAPIFGSIVEYLEDDYPTVVLSAGDNYIPGPFYNAAADPSFRALFNAAYNTHFGLMAPDPLYNSLREGGGRVDITIMNLIGFDASAVGNHEFDNGPDAFETLIEPEYRSPNGPPGDRWVGAQFPYLSANLDFSASPDLGNLFTSDILENTAFATGPAQSQANATSPKLAPATVIEVDGEKIGVVGATTQLVETISSTGEVDVIGAPGVNDMPQLAGVLQPVIDDVIDGDDDILGTADDINKIILVTHLQQISLEKALLSLLNGVDVIIAGGSDTIQANAGDALNAGDTADEAYPYEGQNQDGDTAYIVSTDGEYSYVGRLLVYFDNQGIPQFINENLSGPIATGNADSLEQIGFGDDATYADLRALTEVDDEIEKLTDGVFDVIIAKDGNVFGFTTVFLEGRREAVRTQETNLGNLTADANLWQAQLVDPNTVVSLKNGGGIRAAIGIVEEVSPGVYVPSPPPANPLSGKNEGEISQLDIENTLRFNNNLTLLTVTIAELVDLLEHGVAASGPGNTPGQFPQVAGVRFTYDTTLPAGSRIRNAVLNGTNGVEIIVNNGQIAGDPSRTIRMVTLGFLAGGGDGYPFPSGAGANRVDLDSLAVVGPNLATFEDFGTEQDALAEYLAQFAPSAFDPFTDPETEPALDRRIMNVLELPSTEDLFSLAPRSGSLAHVATVKYNTGLGQPALIISGLTPDFFVQGGIFDPATGNWIIYDYNAPQLVSLGVPNQIGEQVEVDLIILLSRDTMQPPAVPPVVSVEYGMPAPELVLGPPQQIDLAKFQVLAEGPDDPLNVTMELDTEPGKQYVITYTPNLQTAGAGEIGALLAPAGNQITPPFTANANRFQWTDTGPPYTYSEVGDQRFYLNYREVLSINPAD